MQVATKQQHFLSHSLQDAFLLQDEIRDRKEQIRILEREISDRETKVDEIITNHQQAGVINEGPFSIVEKPGRESVDIELLKRRFPWVYEKVVKTKESATKADVAKHLPGSDIELVVKKSKPTYLVDYDIRHGAEC